MSHLAKHVIIPACNLNRYQCGNSLVKYKNNLIRIYFDATCNVTYHVVMYNQFTPEKNGKILIHAIGYCFYCIAWADIRMGTIRKERYFNISAFL